MDKGDMGGVGDGSPLGRQAELVEALCRAHEPQLLQYLTRMLGRTDLAREVIQDTYERIQKIYRPEDVMFPRAMLYKIATNFALMRLRRALEEFVIGGIDTSIPLHRKLVGASDFINGDYDIRWLEKFVAPKD